jgi:hypothetical protein
MQVGPAAAAAARANTDQAASEASNPTVSGGVSLARTEDSTEPVVTGMRVRQMPSAPRPAVAAAAETSQAGGVADPNAADMTGVTPLQAARAKQQTEIADVLLRAGARKLGDGGLRPSSEHANPMRFTFRKSRRGHARQHCRRCLRAGQPRMRCASGATTVHFSRHPG